MDRVFEKMPQSFTCAIMRYGFDNVTREDAMQLVKQIKDCPKIQRFGNVPYIERRVWLDKRNRCVKVEYEQIACKMY